MNKVAQIINEFKPPYRWKISYFLSGLDPNVPLPEFKTDGGEQWLFFKNSKMSKWVEIFPYETYNYHYRCIPFSMRLGKPYGKNMDILDLDDFIDLVYQEIYRVYKDEQC